MVDSWVAIDFETANEYRGSPCAAALVAVDGGQVTATESFFIRPPEFRFTGFNVALHGIAPDMCVDAARWPEALDRIMDFAAGRPFVAHYAAFDTGVIRDACDLVELSWPEFRYACTLVIARRTWPDLPSHSLPYVAAACGVGEWNHHDPLGDAVTAAQVALGAMRAQGVASMDELLAATLAVWGRIDREYWRGCHGSWTRGRVARTPSPDAVFDVTNPLYDRTVVFTGELAIVRRQAQQMVVDIGGHVATGVSKKVDLLVTGYQDLTRLAAGQDHSEKYRKAVELREAGYPVEIISELDFYRAIRSSNADSGNRRPILPEQRTTASEGVSR